jgi:pimeloyl-ACP methyl ester carboxylesterase
MSDEQNPTARKRLGARRLRNARTAATATWRSSRWMARWLVQSPSRWLGRRSSVGQDLTGTSDGLTYLRGLARGNRVRRNASFDNLDTAAPPVLLIHGFLGTRGSMFLLERRLQVDGFVVVSFNIGTFNTRDIRRSAFLIHRKIERLLAQTPWQKIDIVGHSMGGLIGLYYAKKLGGHTRVRKLIMVGTPLHGTWVALLGVATLGLWSTSSWQLLPRSRFLDELAQGPMPGDVEVHTLGAARDWIVPLERSHQPGIPHVTVPLGHSSLVVAEDVYRRIAAILRPQPIASIATPPPDPSPLGQEPLFDDTIDSVSSDDAALGVADGGVADGEELPRNVR